MAERRAEVGNAADAEQVHRAERRIDRRLARYRAALRAVMATPEGRLVFGDRELGIIARAGVFRSVFNVHGGVQSANIGRQDFGHELMADLLATDEALYELMEREARQLAARDARETDAAHTRAASDTTTN